ncbi:MAG: hypothetical protein R2794_09370 [Chitinophagales bacterium]
MDAGFVLTMFGAGSMAGGYLGGFFSDRVGPFRVQIFSLILGGFFLFVHPAMSRSVQLVCHGVCLRLHQ